MRSTAQINLIYKHTHRDYKSNRDGIKCIMYYDQGTTSGPIAEMPESKFKDKLAFAEKQEIKAKRDKTLMPIFKKFGIESYLKGSHQWRDTEQEVINTIISATRGNTSEIGRITQEQANEAITLVKAADITYPEQ